MFFLCVFVFYCVLGISILHFGSIVDNFIGCVPCLMFAFDFAFVFILQLDCIVRTSSVFSDLSQSTPGIHKSCKDRAQYRALFGYAS